MDHASVINRSLTGLNDLVKGFFTLIIRGFEIPLVRTMELLKKRLRLKYTYYVENAFVALVLGSVVVLTGHAFDPWQWLQALAVYLTFDHASVSRCMEEEQLRLLARNGTATVQCFHKLEPLFITKESLWMIIFVHLHAWPALVGVVLFLLFYPWRDAWLRHHSLS